MSKPAASMSSSSSKTNSCDSDETRSDSSSVDEELTEEYIREMESVKAHLGRGDDKLVIQCLSDRWAEQRGLCWLSELPMDLTSTGLYTACACSKRTNQEMDFRCGSENVVLVLKVVADMQAASGLSWSRFHRFVRKI